MKNPVSITGSTKSDSMRSLMVFMSANPFEMCCHYIRERHKGQRFVAISPLPFVRDSLPCPRSALFAVRTGEGLGVGAGLNICLNSIMLTLNDER